MRALGILLLSVIAVGAVVAPAVANHLPSFCFGGPGKGFVGFARDNPECFLGPCVHHPEKEPAPEECFRDCKGLSQKLANAKAGLERYKDEMREALEGIEELSEVIAAEEAKWIPRAEKAIELLDRLGAPRALPNGETGVDVSVIPDRWRLMLWDFTHVTLFEPFPVSELGPATPEDEAWAREKGALGELRDLEWYHGELRHLSEEMTELWNRERALDETIAVVTMAGLLLQGEIAGLDEQLRRCEAAEALAEAASRV